MVVSSNTLFHFTSKIDHLIDALTNEFSPRYCLEEYQTMFPKFKGRLSEYAVPQVCFCALPLTTISEHLAFYGNLGFGMTKDWCIS